MIDGSSCSRMKFASLKVNYNHFNSNVLFILNLVLKHSLLINLVIYVFHLVYQLHFRTCEGYIYFGRRGAIGGPVLGGSRGGIWGGPGGGGRGGGAGGGGRA